MPGLNFKPAALVLEPWSPTWKSSALPTTHLPAFLAMLEVPVRVSLAAIPGLSGREQRQKRAPSAVLAQSLPEGMCTDRGARREKGVGSPLSSVSPFTEGGCATHVPVCSSHRVRGLNLESARGIQSP